MLDFLRKSLRNRLVGAFLVPTFLSIFLYGGLVYLSIQHGLEKELGKRLVAVSQAIAADMSGGYIASQLSQIDDSNDRVLARLHSRLETMKSATRVRRVFIFDRKRRSIVDTKSSIDFGQQLFELSSDRVEIRSTFEEVKPHASVMFEGEDGTYYKNGYAPITLEGKTVAVVGVAGSAGYFALLTDVGTALILLGGLSIVLVIATGTLLAPTLTRPLSKLVEAARRLGEGQLEAPIIDEDDKQLQRGDEISFLAESMDRMRRDILARDRQMQMMLSGIAHEIRNPLGGMELQCGLLRDDLRQLGESGGDRAIEKVDRIDKQLQYLEQIVKDFLTFARDDVLRIRRFDALEFAREICDLCEGTSSARDVRVDRDVPESLELTGDRTKLKQAVVNLVRNGIQASEDGATVGLEIWETDDNMRCIRVEDEGPGISDDELEHIFEPFFTTRQKGSGLGLALVQKIVSDHEGTIEVETSEQGTVFEMKLPFEADVDDGDEARQDEWLG